MVRWFIYYKGEKVKDDHFKGNGVHYSAYFAGKRNGYECEQHALTAIRNVERWLRHTEHIWELNKFCIKYNVTSVYQDLSDIFQIKRENIKI